MSSELDKNVEELILFISNYIDKEGYDFRYESFDFTIKRVNEYFNAESEEIKESFLLSEFKKKIKNYDDNEIKKIFNKCISEELIKYRSMGLGEYNGIGLTIKGNQKSKNIRRERIEKKKKFITYPIDKIIVPIIVSICISFVSVYVLNKSENDNLNKKIEKLEKDIKWLKTNK